jgi:hypothetical protein
MVTRPDEYGIEETVADLIPAPPELYSNQSAYVPPVLAKWLRPHQREGVLFMVSSNVYSMVLYEMNMDVVTDF